VPNRICQRLLRLRLWALLAAAACMASAASAPASSVSVGGTILTSTSLDLAGCSTASSLSLGSMTGGTTSIAGSACRIQFGASGAAHLAMYQRDGDGAAMTQARQAMDTRSGVPSYKAADLVDANDLWVGGSRVTATDPVPLKHTTDGGATWTDVTPCAAVTSVSWIFAWSASEVLIASGNRACRSTDTGATWTTINLPLSINSRLVNAPGTDVLWANTTTSGRLLRSTDRGVTWSNVTTPATTAFANVVGWGTQDALAINNVTAADQLSRTAFAWRTTDGGATWTQSTIATIPVTTIPATTGSLSHLDRSSVSGRIIAIGSWAQGTRFQQYSSDDGGATWTTQPLPPFTDQLRYVSGGTWIGGNRMNVTSQSTDDGLTWTNRTIGGGSTAFYLFATREQGGNILVVGEAASVYRSADQGATWSSVAPTFPTYDAVVAFDALHLAVVGSDGAALTSADSGATMSAATGCGGSTFRDGVATSLTAGMVVGGAGKICRTTDSGATWTNVASPTGSSLVEVTRIPATGELIAHGTSTTNFIRSTDDGASWQLLPISVSGGVGLFATDDDGSTRVMSRNSNGTMWVSTDSGATWTALDDGVPSPLQSVAIAPSGGRIVTGHYPTSSDNQNKLAVSTDAGATWTSAPVAGGAGEVLGARFTSDQRLWLLAGGKIVVSDDAGATFTTIATSPGKPSNLDVLDANTVLTSGLGRLLAASRPTVSVPDVAAGTALGAGAGSAFGACLLATTATPAWTPDGTCAAASTTAWKPVPVNSADANATIASIPGGSATADIVYGLRVSTSQAPGSYLAHISYDVVAP
jgi:photosystem II stability/assembly factor-like uncharacterized protein